MYISIDFNSDEALYLQLRNQIVYAIVDVDEIKARMELAQTMDLILAQAICKNVSREDVHKLVDEIYNQYEGYRNGESL